MGSSGRGGDTLDAELRPSLEVHVEDEGLARHGVFACVSSGSAEQYHFVLVHHRDSVTEAGLWLCGVLW